MFFDFFFDKILEERQSPFNGEIKVLKYQGQKKLIANNLMQSGDWIRKMWAKPIRHIVGTGHDLSLPIHNILLLGLGGGTILQLLTKYWPQAQVTAVEIDQNMVDLAKKYFNLDKYRAKIIVDDAFKFVGEGFKPSPTQPNFDLIIVDLFCGDEINPGINKANFINNCSQLLTPSGIILTNLLFFGKYKEIAEEFINKMDLYFSDLQLVRHRWNLFVIGRIPCYRI